MANSFLRRRAQTEKEIIEGLTLDSSDLFLSLRVGNSPNSWMHFKVTELLEVDLVVSPVT